MHDPLIPLIVLPLVLIGLPWLILHYITRWKTAATLTTDDEHLLEDLYQLARRLDERMETVERLVASDHPDFQPRRLESERELDSDALRELDRILNKGDRP